MSNAALPCMLHCSPRPSGNSAAALELFFQGLDAGPKDVQRLFLREHSIQPCAGCGRCARHPGLRCPFEAKDGSAPLLRALETAPALCLVSPIYFYHLPAQFKALIDRTQPFWEARQHGVASRPKQGRPVWAILLAARPKGAKLFEGSLLTLRCCFDNMGLSLRDPLCLYGLDGPGDLAANPEAREAVTAYARAARERFLSAVRE